MTSRKSNHKIKCLEILAKKKLGFTVHEIANEFNCTVRTIYTNLQKGKMYE